MQLLNYFSVTASPPRYDDPYYELQPGLVALQLSASHAWATGKGVRVAVIDTGVDTAHPDLAGRLAGIRNFVDRSQRAFDADVHGTAVAGVIAARTNNGLGMVGVAPDAELVALKACAQVEAGQSAARCTSFTLAKALDFAIGEDVDVINLSLTGPPDPLLERLVQSALQAGIVVVGAAAPDADDAFPGGTDGVIAVAPTKRPAHGEGKSPISAPGSQILSTSPDAGFDFFNGSSFAAAHVSGVVALIKQRKPHLSTEVVKGLLEGTAEPATGQVNACLALERIVAGGACPNETASARAMD